MIDLSIRVCDWGLNKSAVTSDRNRKWKKKLKFSTTIFEIKTYITLLGLFLIVQTIYPICSWSINFRLCERKVSNSQFSMPCIFFITKVFHLKLIFVVNTRIVYSNVKWFWKMSLPLMRYELRNWKIAFQFSQKSWNIDSWNFQVW
jgi:hypothetical protein